MNPEIEIKILSSLARVFPDRIYGGEETEATAAAGQEICFQLAMRRVAKEAYAQKPYTVTVDSALAEHITLSRVGYVPSELPAYTGETAHDDNYLTLESGLFPDPLFPVVDGIFLVNTLKWHSLWVSVKLPSDVSAGVYPITLKIAEGEKVTEVTYTLSVKPFALPAQSLIFTQWFHVDCIADVHQVAIYSEEHWALIEKYMRLAKDHGMTMIYTPVLTPALDTAVGGERPTVQLLGIKKYGAKYEFDFERLRRYIKLAQGCGYEYFEISHFFTQWGAHFTPKVMAEVDGKTEKIFGWQTPAESAEYADFLNQLIPALTAELTSLGIAKDHIYYHVSDEPNFNHLESYRKASGTLRPLIDGCHHLDALSDIDFHREGLVETSVVATNKIEPFLDASIENLWCYYCCSQAVDVANRFLAMPSARNRIIGVQLYKYGIKGFLHWGYNFYNARWSAYKINPYCVTDAGAGFPSGDAFSVYPHEDGVIPSLRIKVFKNALEDMRLLSLLEEKIGRDAVISALDRIAGMEITFRRYPKDDEFFTRLYDFIFEELLK